MTGLNCQLRGYRLTTAEILYHLPDHPKLLQSFTWQYLDLAPRFPELRRFLDFWSRDIDAVLHSVKVGAVEMVSGSNFRHHRHELTLH